ncbi:MAG: hypothetical protein ACRD44_07785 [Bryobacteraceae bacterium]
MAGDLYLSYWLRGFTASNMLRHFAAALSRFPFSRISPRLTLRVFALEYTEPPLLERGSEGPEIEEALRAAAEFSNDDCAYEISAAWDIWQWSDDVKEWTLAPAMVRITCYAPLFPSDVGEQIRFDFGDEDQFVPPDLAGHAIHTTLRSNIRSLLHLGKDLDDVLKFEKRALWSESGQNLAERLEQGLRI